MRALRERREERVLEAHDAGVQIYAGTDAGSVIRHGRIADEVVALHAAGLPMASALDAACCSARKWLGAEGIEEGAPRRCRPLPGRPPKDARGYP